MQIALIADIHGNSIALDAVLADIRARGVDQYWILGDLCAIGYDPAGVLERLAALPDALFVRGNADRYVINGDRPRPTFAEARANPDLIPVLAEVAGSFAWTQGYLEGRGWQPWLANLPLEQRVTLPDGARALLVHASPGTDDESGLNPALDDAQTQARLNGADEALICVGHFHMPMDRRLGGRRIVNPGSVSNSFGRDLRPAYALLTADSSGHNFSFHRVAYDRDAALAANRRTTNPGAAFVERCLQGEISASWYARWDGVTHAPPGAS